MNILKPQRQLFESLTQIDNLLEKIEKEDELENITIENYKKEKIEFTDITIKKAIINNTDFINSNLEKNTFIDIEFNNCNFSNTSFDNCSFIRCEFNNCKLTGCNFIESGLYDIGFIDTNMNYTNISMSSMKNILFKNTMLRNSSFQENKIKNVILKEVDLTRTQFFKTSLNGIDLSSSVIEGIAISIEDIKGATINQFQSLDLMYLLGVKIKEDGV